MIWVKQAKQEHDAFVEVMRDRGIEVFYAEELLTDVLGIPEPAIGSSVRCWTKHVGLRLARSRREWAQPRPREVADYLIGGMTKEDLEGGAGLKYDASVAGRSSRAAAPELHLPARSLVLDLRRGDPQPDGEARAAETAFMEAIYCHHPMFADEEFKIWHGGVETDWGPATVEGGDVMPLGKGIVMIGMGERTSPRRWDDRPRALQGRLGVTRLAVMLRSRSYMHLDTVLTMIDLDAVTLFPDVTERARVWRVRRGTIPRSRSPSRSTAWLRRSIRARDRQVAGDPHRRRSLRDRTGAVGRRQQRRLPEPGVVVATSETWTRTPASVRRGSR